MDLGITGKVAFVAGGSKGMGRAAAELLAAEGCKVAVIARDPAGIDEAVAFMKSNGATVMGVSGDLTTREGVKSAVTAVVAEFGDPDIVIGLTNDDTRGDFDEVSDEDFEASFRRLSMAQVYLARETIPAMRRKKWGRYIHIGSQCAREPELAHPHIVHNTVRPATTAFLRVLANEVAADGVTVNSVGPGFILTPSMENFITNEMGLTRADAENWLAGRPFPAAKNRADDPRIPMKRAGRMSEIGGIVTFLASEYGGYITGEWIAVDGGRHAFSS
jgi:3-oxoacyl-[acyl-carrier protein] reductase